MMRRIVVIIMTCLLSACGFHPQGQLPLAKPLHKMYIDSMHPYGDLTRYLETCLTTSSVKLTSDRNAADTILLISQDDTAQELTGVSGSQQTRQYNIHVTVTFDVTDKHGRSLITPQTLIETRTITVQANQILGSSNEANIYYRQMRRTLAFAIMNRLASRSITRAINTAYHLQSGQTHS